MAALSEAVVRDSKKEKSIRFLQANSTTFYKGAFASLDMSTGHILPHTDAASRAFIGVYNGDNANAGDGSTTYQTVSTERKILRRVTVTGVSAQTDIGKPVYITTDNDPTITRPSDDATCIGMVIAWYSSTTCDVLIFDPLDSFLYGMTQRGKKVLHLGVSELAVGTGNHISSYPLFGHGLIVDYFIVPDGQGAGASADVSFNLEIGGTNLTGGVVQVELADGQATTRVDDTAITAANEFHDGDLLDVEGAQATAFTAGRVNHYIVVEMLP